MGNADEVLLIAGGIYNLGFAVSHPFFWRIFDWGRDLASLTAVNRSVMQILNLCLTFLLFFMAYVSLFMREPMLSTDLGRALLIAIAMFWFLRMLEQIFLFEVRNRLSAVFAMIFLVGSVLYIVPVI